MSMQSDEAERNLNNNNTGDNKVIPSSNNVTGSNKIVNSNTSSTTVNSGGETQDANNSPKILSLSIKDIKVLYTAFMSFISQGALFIPTKKSFNMGDTLPLMISLMDENIKYSVNGKVVWITPNNAHNRAPGIGVQFTGEQADKLLKKITNILDKYQFNKEATNTM